MAVDGRGNLLVWLNWNQIFFHRWLGEGEKGGGGGGGLERPPFFRRDLPFGFEIHKSWEKFGASSSKLRPARRVLT